jgi:hypothetical protein
LFASYGVNRFVVKFPRILAEDYPEHVRNATLYGRVAAEDMLINLDMELEYDHTASTELCL